MGTTGMLCPICWCQNVWGLIVCGYFDRGLLLHKSHLSTRQGSSTVMSQSLKGWSTSGPYEGLQGLPASDPDATSVQRLCYVHDEYGCPENLNMGLNVRLTFVDVLSVTVNRNQAFYCRIPLWPSRQIPITVH